jgi:hypothetical protein
MASILAADASASAALALLAILPVFLVAPPGGCTRLDRDPLTPSRRRCTKDHIVAAGSA